MIFLLWNNFLVYLRLRLMETILESTNKRNPSDENPGPFPSFGNIGASYMATLSLPGFTIGLPVWLISTPMVLNVQTAPQPRSPPLEQVHPNIDPFPSSVIISSSFSFFSHGESLDSSNQEAKKKKQNNEGGNQTTISTNATSMEKSSK